MKRAAPLILILMLSDWLAATQTSAAPYGRGENPLMQEFEDRAVDAAAISSQKVAIRKMQELTRKFKGTPQEPMLLVKLAELQQKTASMLFRTAHGDATKKRKAVDLSAYNTMVLQSIGTLNQLISNSKRYPRFEKLGRAYFLRAKGYRDIGDTKRAVQEFNEFIKKYPKTEEATRSHMAIADLALEAKNYTVAIESLKRTQAKPSDSYYPIVLENLAWAYFSLGDISQALKYTENLVVYAKRKIRQAEDNETHKSLESGEYERALNACANYYVGGIERRVSGYTVDGAFDYFKNIAEPPYFGKMAAIFATTLRGKGQEQDLLRWKDLMVTRAPENPETLKVILATYEDLVNRQRLQLISKLPQDLAAVLRVNPGARKDPAFTQLARMTLETAEKIHQAIEKKDYQAEASIISILTTLYSSYLQLVDSNNPNILKVKFRLGEFYFKIKEFDRATEQWRAVYSAAGKKDGDLKKQAHLKSISSSYESLRAAKLIPQNLKAHALTGDSSKELDPKVADWIKWLDSYPDRKETSLEAFEFEANRTIYEYGNQSYALDRLAKYAIAHPTSKYAIPSASLVIDTYIASQDWKKTHSLAQQFMQIKAWEKDVFSKQLANIASDAYFKGVEEAYNKKDFSQSIQLAEQYMKQYPSGKHFSEALGIAGSSAAQTDQKPLALSFYNRIIEKDPNSEFLPVALAAQVGDHEQKYDFAGAAKIYIKLLEVPASRSKIDENKKREIRKKTLLLALLADQTQFLQTVLSNRQVCLGIEEDCEKYSAVSQLLDAHRKTEEIGFQAFKRSRRAGQKTRLFWTAIALENPAGISFQDLLTTLKLVASDLEQQEPLFKLILLSKLNESVPRSLQRARMQVSLNKNFPLDGLNRAVKMRIESIQAVESVSTQLVKLPWAKLKASALNEASGLYLDLAHDLKKVRVPGGIDPKEAEILKQALQGLWLPFEEKGQEIRSKAYEIAADQAVEEDLFHRIALPLFQENPNLAKTLKPETLPPSAPPLNSKILLQLNPDGGWDGRNNKPLQSKWAQAIYERKVPQMAFFIQESAQSEKQVEPGIRAVAKGFSLISSGAQSEGLAELQESLKYFDAKEAQSKILITLLGRYFTSLSKEKTKSAVSQLADIGSNALEPIYKNPSDALFFAAAAHWNGVELSQEVSHRLQDAIFSSSATSNSEWRKILYQKSAPEEKKK